jgi:hypothetical protein
VCSNDNDGVSHWPHLYAGVADHPAALYRLLRDSFVRKEQLENFLEEEEEDEGYFEDDSTNDSFI